MIGHWFSVRRLLTIVGLVAAWCALWGSVSIANVLSGTVLSIAVLWASYGTEASGGVRVVPLLRFVGLVAADLVLATVNVAKEILTPTDYTDESIVAVRPPLEARRHLLLLVVAVTVTPGTAVVDTDPDNGTLYLHLLHHDRADATIAHVEELARLACAALPVADRAGPARSEGRV
jgi:multicomponent Na+:H+ antiporter subunit E